MPPATTDATAPAVRPDVRDFRRFRHFLAYNTGSLAIVIVGMTILNAFVLRSSTAWMIAAILGVTLLMSMTAGWFAHRSDIRSACTALMGGTWVTALGTLVFSPFLLPVNVLVAVLPLHAIYPFLSPATMRRVVLPLTALVGAAMPVLAVIRHPLQSFPGPSIVATVYLSVIPGLILLIVGAILLSHERVIEQADLLSDSRARIAAASDEARRRIERDLHDGAQQRLVSTNVRLALVAQLMDSAPDKARGALADAQAELKTSLEELRELAHGIYPPLLTDRGVATALESVTRTMPVPVVIDVDLPIDLSPDIAAAAYFCSLEAVQNATKHAHANRIVVSGRTADGLVRFSVTDDGLGIRDAEHGAGLTNIADRVSAVGGTLDVTSNPHQGTRVAAIIPVPE